MEVKLGYKQTEVGVIPEEWEVAPLEQVSDPQRSIRYGIVQVGPFTNGGISVLAIKNLNTDYVTNVHRCVPGIEKRYARSRVSPGDVLISVKGTVGRIGLVPNHYQGNISRDLARLSLTDADVPGYWFQMLQSESAQGKIGAVTVGTTRLELSIGILKQLSMPRAPKEEQRAIAGALSDVDALIGAQDQLIAKKRDLKQATMQQLLTGQTRLPGFSGEWEVKQLGEVGRFAKGKGIKKDEVVAEGVPCIRYGEIYTHHHDYIRQFRSFIPRSIAEQSQRLQRGDLLFAGSGETAEEIGKCVAFLGEEEAYAGGDIVILTPTGHNSMYLGYLMNHASIVEQKARLGQGDAVVHVSARHLAQLTLHLPKELEQTAIATVFFDMDAELVALEQRRDKTRDLKQGMMQELLTGRTRLA